MRLNCCTNRLQTIEPTHRVLKKTLNSKKLATEHPGPIYRRLGLKMKPESLVTMEVDRREAPTSRCWIQGNTNTMPSSSLVKIDFGTGDGGVSSKIRRSVYPALPSSHDSLSTISSTAGSGKTASREEMWSSPCHVKNKNIVSSAVVESEANDDSIVRAMEAATISVVTEQSALSSVVNHHMKVTDTKNATSDAQSRTGSYRSSTINEDDEDDTTTSSDGVMLTPQRAQRRWGSSSDLSDSIPMKPSHIKSLDIPIPTKVSFNQIQGELPLLRDEKEVSFGQVHVRYYERILGDHPSCQSGPSMGIGWKYYKSCSINIDMWESHRRRRHRRHNDYEDSSSLLLSRNEREEMLRQLGYKQWEIAQAIRQTRKIKHSRCQTILKLKHNLFQPLQERLYYYYPRKYNNNNNAVE